MSEDLKPCPFCGESASIERYGTRRFSTIVSCDWCGCSHESSEEFNHGREWNTRHNPAIEELEGLVDYIFSNIGFNEDGFYMPMYKLSNEDKEKSIKAIKLHLINKHKEGGE